ncbi:MAG: alcohol dehydrogenase [Gammaproteobacteria bacterium]|nr:MAG: alcohol dehydrogenase [Gammaproteobacteria bacterium]RLA53780.1 MAG: alcohol dehydrogenase [Gammaproteobacteria bacterium]
MKAAVLREFNQPLSIEEVSISKPKGREVLVRTAASGICHSDLHVIDGLLPMGTPTILGHEPAGIVEAVGSDVTEFKPGDHIIGCPSAFCSHCEFCMEGRGYLCSGQGELVRGRDEEPRLSAEGEYIRQFSNLSSFAEKMLIHANGLVKIRDDMPLDRAALIGCGVTTGLGAALNTAQVAAGDSVSVIGCGGVGLSIIQGARIAGANRIIAVDTLPWKLELAAKMGATDGVNATEVNAIEAVRELTSGGVDYAFEAIGVKQTVEQACGMARRGGAAVIVGVVPAGTKIEFDGLDLVLQQKRILGSIMGSNRFRIDMPRYVEFYMSGRLQLDEMISERFKLEEINEAIQKLRDGKVARGVIEFDA